MIHERYDNHNITFSKNENSVYIIEGWPIKNHVKLCNGTSKLSEYSVNGKLAICEKLWKFIEEKGLRDQMISILKSDENYVVLSVEEWNKQLNNSRMEGAKSQQQYLKDETLGYSKRNRGLYLPQNGQEKLRKGIELETVEQYKERKLHEKPEFKRVPNYFTTELKKLIVETIDEKLESGETEFLKLNKSEIARSVSQKIDDPKIKKCLLSTKGGYFVSIVYGDEKQFDLKTLFKDRKKRAYKKSSVGVSIHNTTQQKKNKKVHDALVYGLHLSDSDIRALVDKDLTYVGDLFQDEKGNYSLIRDIRSVFGELLLKIYDLDGFLTKEGDLKVKFLHWGDGSKLLGSGFFLAAVLIDYVSSGIFDTSNQQVIAILKNWLPYYMSFQQENKENMEEFMLKRKDIMERLTEPFQLTEKLIVTFELQDYIGDLSHFWKIFQITNSFCAHCMSNYPKLKFIQEKTKQRRSISTLIADSSNKTHGVGISLLNCFGEYEKNCNATTTCDVLHTLKGSIEEIINLLENIDGIDHEMITEIQQEVLQKGDVSILSGGHTRLFLLNYQKWIPQLSNLLKENSDISQRRKQIYERFEYGKDNLEWILFLMSLISKMAYRSEYNKKPYEVAFIETLTCLLYISLKSRYGDEFMTKHFHGLLIHFPQDFERTFQRLCSCERGEFLISILKRVSLTESNRSQDNALLAMVLSVTAHLERLLSGEKDNYVDNSKMFDNIDISDCNFVISGNVLKSKYLPELEWFLEYLKSKKLDEYVKVERNQQKIITSIEFCFSNEWEFCSLDCNSLIYDSARAPIVDAAENNSNREKCQCGKPCNQNCTSNIVKHCNKCCHIQQYQDSSNRKDCKAHRISKKEFVEKYLVSESEGMKAINSKKAKERKIKDQLNEIAVRLKSELEKEEESTHKRRKNDESFQKRKKSKKENSILDVNNSKSNDLIVNNLISSQNHTQTTNSTQLTLSADTEINSQPNFSQSQHQESQIIDTGTTKNTSSRRKGRRK